jgi:hypothetical protein
MMQIRFGIFCHLFSEGYMLPGATDLPLWLLLIPVLVVVVAAAAMLIYIANHAKDRSSLEKTIAARGVPGTPVRRMRGGA